MLTQEVEDGTRPPVVYASRTLQPHGQNYGAAELEDLRVVWFVNHFDIIVVWTQMCLMFTDNKPFKSLLNTPQPSGKLATWRLILDMDMEIKYRPGRKNSNVDALSRYPEDLPTMQDAFAELHKGNGSNS